MELTEKPHLFSILKELDETVGIPLKFLHVIRNPFDVISTWVLRRYNVRLAVNDGKTKVNTMHALQIVEKKRGTLYCYTVILLKCL